MLKSKFFGIIFSGLVLITPVLAADEPFVYDAKSKRDPFSTLVTPEGLLIKVDDGIREEKKELQIEGIIHDDQGVSFAIVNGAVVKVGDFVGAYQVLKIEAKKVIFIKDGLTSEVELTKEEN